MDQRPRIPHQAENDPTAILVLVQEGGPHPPLFFVHGVAGNRERFNNLVRHLGADETIYVLQEQSVAGNRPILTSVEDMAAVYVQEMKRVQPEGPYFVIGYSFGGLISFEIAQQLQRKGQRVPFVALIDAGQPIFRKDFANMLLSPKALGSYLRRVRELCGDPEGRRTLWSRLRDETWRALFLKLPKPLAKSNGQPLPRNQAMLEAARIEASVNYKPTPFTGRLSVFRVEKRISVDKFDRYLGWGRLADAIDVYDVPGDHVSVCEEPHVSVFAAKFKLAIRAARDGNHREPR